MRIEETEDSIKLVPESSWEKATLKKMREKGVGKVRFQNDWESTGYLELFYPEHPWDK